MATELKGKWVKIRGKWVYVRSQTVKKGGK